MNHPELDPRIKLAAWDVVPLLYEVPREEKIIEYRCTARRHSKMVGLIITDLRCKIDIHKLCIGAQDLDVITSEPMNTPFSKGIQLFANPIPFFCPMTLRVVIELERRSSQNLIPTLVALVALES